MSTKIDVLKDGPLIVDNLNRLKNSKGDRLPIDDKIALCVCGGSHNKPFCDGTHKTIGFSSKRETDKPINEESEYKGADITIFDNRTICCHAAECVSSLNSVFNIKSKPWINPDNAGVDEIIEVIEKCPSGALSYSIGGVHKRDFPRDAEIEISKDGPYNVSGNIELGISEEIKPPSSEHYSLCRCGASKNKPYCDGSHSAVKFRDEEN